MSFFSFYLLLDILTAPAAAANDTWWKVFLVDSGKQLWLFDGIRTIYKYLMP